MYQQFLKIYMKKKNTNSCWCTWIRNLCSISVNQWTSVPCVYREKRMFSLGCPRLWEKTDTELRHCCDFRHSCCINFKGNSLSFSCVPSHICVRTHRLKQKLTGKVFINLSLFDKRASDDSVSLCWVIHFISMTANHQQTSTASHGWTCHHLIGCHSVKRWIPTELNKTATWNLNSFG